jgi:Sec-independent protein translocase protein TatA
VAWFFAILSASIFLPVIVYFIWALLRDPAFPELVRAVGNAAKRRWTTYLSQESQQKTKRKKKKKKQTKEKASKQMQRKCSQGE